METKLRQAEALLREHGQEHLLEVLGRASGEQQESLTEQILAIDYRALKEVGTQTEEKRDAELAPIPSLDAEQWSERERESFAEAGWAELKAGRVGVIVVAGGQGSRLGHDGPKGTMDIGLPSGKLLFQIQAERLLNVSARAGRFVPWYIMTSPDNHDVTAAFFREHGYFGYPEEEIYFFQQHTMPAIDHAGRLLLSGPAEINFTASGNGECFSSLARTGALADMKRRGLAWLFYYNVDNALVKMADPAFIGAAVHFGYPVATKVVEKKDAGEKVGMACLKDGRPSIVEYTEFPPSLLEERDAAGRLLFNLGNMSIHLFSLPFIERHADTDVPYHAASKKIVHVDREGRTVTPEKPNAYKLERFIFDFFPLAEGMTVLKVNREEEFAPVKNKEGADSPESARRLLLALHRRWLLAAGVSEEELAGQEPEVSPLVSCDGEGLDAKTVRELLDHG